MQQAGTTTAAPADRPVERSSRLSNGLIPLVAILLVIVIAQLRRRRAANAARPPADPPQGPPS